MPFFVFKQTLFSPVEILKKYEAIIFVFRGSYRINFKPVYCVNKVIIYNNNTI